LYWLEQLA